MIRQGNTKTLMVRAELLKKNAITVFGIEFSRGQSKRFIGGKACRPFDYLQAGAVMAFTARSKNLVEGNPEDRRRFLDRMITYLDPHHISRLSRYRKILGQLRSLLVGDRNLGVYKGFKSTLAPFAREIVDKRRSFLTEVRDSAGRIYRDVFEGQGQLHLEYKMRGIADFSSYEKRINDISAREVLYGKSMIGPHLDDLNIALSDSKARRYASSGQVRAIVLSLKIAVHQAYFESFGSHPVLLLDDIDAELDPKRLKRLLDYLSGRGQTLISTSKYDTIMAHREGCVHIVDAGRISPERNSE
jgi:DNA replication and repair protein RecF